MAEGVEESGSVATIVLLEDVTLSSTFDDNESEAYRISPLSQIELIIDYTMHTDETDAKGLVKLLFSTDNVNYHDYSIASDQSPASGVVQSILYPRHFRVDGVTGGVTETRWFAVPTAAKWFKVLAAEQDASSGPPQLGTMTVKARVSDGVILY
jgi:hypothetical protein